MNPEKKDRSARATVFKTKRAKTTRSPTTSRKNLSQKTKSEKNITKSKKIGSPSVMGGGGERFNKSAPDRSRKTSPDDRSDKSQKMKRAPNRTLLKTPPSLNLVSVQKAKTIMNRSKKPSDRSQQKPRQKAVSVLKISPSLNLVSVQGKKGDHYTIMKTRMQSVAKKQSVFPSTRKKRGDDHDGKSIAIGTSLMTEAVPSPPPTVFPKKTGAIKVLDTESVTSTTDPSRTVVSQPKSRRKLAKGEQTTFDFLTPKGTRSTRYATSTRRPGAKGSHIVPCMCLIVLFVMLVGALVVWMFGATTSEKKITSSTSTIIMSSIASTTTDLPPIEIAIPVEFETSTTTTVSTTTVTYTTAVKRPPLNDGAWKEACGSPCWYHPGKFATSCQSIECHSVRLFVGQGLRGQANYSFYVIKQSAPLTRKSTSVPEGTPCKPPGRKKVGVCSGRQCVDIIDQSDIVKFDKYGSDPINGEWTTFRRYTAESCFESHNFYKVASQLLKPKYTDLCSPRSSSKICYPFMAGFRSCTKKHPANGGKHCFQIDRLSGWLKIDDKYSPVGIRACPLCKDKHKWPPARPLDFKPDCNHVFHDEFFCHLAYGDFSDGDKDSLAVSDFDYCCIGRELGRCLLGTCTPLI